MAKKKFYYEAAGECPHCSKPIEIKVRRVVVEKAIPAQVDLRLMLEKDEQQRLNNE